LLTGAMHGLATGQERNTLSWNHQQFQFSAAEN
jgi:hypothetical protein